jgi:hypothetical protein
MTVWLFEMLLISWSLKRMNLRLNVFLFAWIL